MKSLNNVQKIMKAFKIVASIMMTVSIVAFALISVGMIVAATGQNEVEGSPFYHFIGGEEANMDTTKLLYQLSFSLIEALVEAIVFGFLYSYFTKETKEGDPFTEKGIKFLQLSGVVIIVVAAVGSLVGLILNEFSGLPMISATWAASDITIGVFLLIVSVVFKYGYELKEAGKGKEEGK